MRTIAITLITAALAGCAATPLELERDGIQVEFTSRANPTAAAQCVGRAAEEFTTFGTAPFRAIWRAGKTPGTTETLVYGPDLIVLAIASPVPDGTLVRMYHRGVPVLEIAPLLETIRTQC